MDSNNPDRFSQLPDAVIHTIFSLLHTKEIAYISILSRRLRHLCLSRPYLNFNLQEFTDENKMDRFCSYLDRFFALRDGVQISNLRIHLDFGNKYKNDLGFRFETWIYNATKCRVQQLNLEISIAADSIFVLPDCVRSCRELGLLRLDLHGGRIMFPNAHFEFLKILVLKSVRIVNYMFGDYWISSYCKSLKILQLIHCYGVENLTIISSSLKCLYIRTEAVDELWHLKVSAENLQRISVEWLSAQTDNSFTIFAPNLKELAFLGGIVNFSCEGRLDSIRFASLIITTLCSANDSFVKFFRMLNHAKDMILNTNCIKMLKVAQLSLGNLLSAKVITCYWGNDLVPALANFLNGSPNLRTLWIQPCRCKHPMAGKSLVMETPTFNAEYWESKDMRFLHELKVVEIVFFGDSNQIEMIKYLLKHAKALEKMTIIYIVEEDLAQALTMLREIEGFKRASSTAALYHFRIRQWSRLNNGAG